MAQTLLAEGLNSSDSTISGTNRIYRFNGVFENTGS